MRIVDWKYRVGIFLFSFFASSLLQAEPASFFRQGSSARSVAMGSVDTGIQARSESVFRNPSGLADLDQYHIEAGGFNALESQFFMGNIGGKILGFGVGLGLMTVQSAGINENTRDSFTSRYSPTGRVESYTGTALVFGVGRKVGQKLSVGTNLVYLKESAFSASGQGMGLGFSLGYRLLKNLNVAAGIENAVRPVMTWTGASQVSEVVPSLYRLGLNGRWESLSWNLESENQSNRPMIIKGGLSFRVNSFLLLRGGIRDGEPSMGVGLELKGLDLDMSYTNSRLDYLGSIYRFGMGYHF